MFAVMGTSAPAGLCTLWRCADWRRFRPLRVRVTIATRKFCRKKRRGSLSQTTPKATTAYFFFAVFLAAFFAAFFAFFAICPPKDIRETDSDTPGPARPPHYWWPK
jgi:hypothetical protein